MEKIANAIADLINGANQDWTTNVKYDDDGLGPNPATNISLNIRTSGKINLPNFYKWLNSEDFFFGREESSYYSANYKKRIRTRSSIS